VKIDIHGEEIEEDVLKAFAAIDYLLDYIDIDDDEHNSKILWKDYVKQH